MEVVADFKMSSISSQRVFQSEIRDVSRVVGVRSIVMGPLKRYMSFRPTWFSILTRLIVLQLVVWCHVVALALGIGL